MFRDQDPVNIEASELMGKSHDALEGDGLCRRTTSNSYLVRLLFCLFADDTGIFEPRTSSNALRERTREDGSRPRALAGRICSTC